MGANERSATSILAHSHVPFVLWYPAGRRAIVCSSTRRASVRYVVVRFSRLLSMHFSMCITSWSQGGQVGRVSRAPTLLGTGLKIFRRSAMPEFQVAHALRMDSRRRGIVCSSSMG
jgi:hypothetical protein